MVLVQLCWCAPERGCCVHTDPNAQHRNWVKTLSVTAFASPTDCRWTSLMAQPNSAFSVRERVVSVFFSLHKLMDVKIRAGQLGRRLLNVNGCVVSYLPPPLHSFQLHPHLFFFFVFKYLFIKSIKPSRFFLCPFADWTF